MENRKRKGFTVVELVVVIAVIAILSAVLIPTFVNLVHKAQVTADQSLVKNLNTTLAMEDAENGAQPTMYDTLAVMEKRGFVVDRLSPTAASNDIVWDSSKNQFVLIMNDEGKYFTGTDYEKYSNEDYYKLWKIYKEMPENSIYSIYLSGNVTGELNVNAVGIDVGNNIGVTKINYTNTTGNAKTVAIRTNDGEFVTELNVDAETDTVNHYGYLTGLEVISVDTTHSYHEYGKVLGRAKVLGGHVVVEEKAEVGELVVAEEAQTTATVEVASNSKVNTLVVENENVVVDVKENAKVETVVADNTENVNIPTSVVVETIQKTYVYNTHADATETTPEKLTIVEALASGAKYVALAEDISLTAVLDLDYSVTIDGENHTLSTTASRGMWINNSNVVVKLLNLTIDGNNKAERAVQVNTYISNSGYTIDNCVIKNITYYAVNVCGNTSGIVLNITNSSITGWGAVNLWGKGYTVLISNSKLYGYNNKSYNADGWNDFATVILEGDTTARTDEHSSDIDVKIVNSLVSATTSGQGNSQWCILFNNPSAHNNVTLDNCELLYSEEANTYLVLGNDETNHLYKNGVLVEE